jgi:eukaryotic-like serine/threonine-protein kinase
VLACKRATGPDDVERLRHEATVLRRAQHPGVVELVACREVDGVTTLCTRFVGAHSLETSPPMVAEQAAATMAKLATTVADLHRLGIVHGRIDPSHVLLGPSGRPVLCGFTGASAHTEVPPEGPGPIAEFRDPAAIVGAPPSPTVDLYALGTLLRMLLVGEGADFEPIPERRFMLKRGRPWNGYLRRALLTLADQCTDEEPLRRPAASRLAADIEALLPRAGEAPLPATPEPVDVTDDDDPFASPTAKWLMLVASVVGLAFIFWGVMVLRGGTTNATSSLSRPTTSSSAIPSSMPSTSAPPSVARHIADVTLVGDRVVSVDGRRFSVGDPGDRVVLGDWDCDGTPTAAIARPSTGEVFVFDRWPDADAEATVRPVGTVSGAVDLRTEARGDCSLLFAVRADRSESEVL